MRILFFVGVLVMFALSCRDNQSMAVNPELPLCLKNLITDTTATKDLISIQAQVVDNKQYYWLNTDFRHFDGVEYIVTAQCDTTCMMCGECIVPTCLDDFPDNQWEVIWEN